MQMAHVMHKFMRRLFWPTVIPLVVAGVVGLLILGIGETLLGLVVHDAAELERPELWFGLVFAVTVLGGAFFLAYRPEGSLGVLDKELAIGKRPFFAPEELPPIAPDARTGSLGTVDDVAPGYTLYARSGALARVVGLIGPSEEFGRRFRGFMYAQGVYGASDELWIPYEAVMAVYPETRSAFLAIKGDETEHYGWNRPPANLRTAPHANHFPTAH